MTVIMSLVVPAGLWNGAVAFRTDEPFDPRRPPFPAPLGWPSTGSCCGRRGGLGSSPPSCENAPCICVPLISVPATARTAVGIDEPGRPLLALRCLVSDELLPAPWPGRSGQRRRAFPVI